MSWIHRFDGGRIQSMLSHLSYHSSIEHFASRWIRRIVWRGPTGSPHVSLTFDDGPHPEYTPRLLDILARHQTKATFFLIGRHAERHATLAERIVREGHEIVNHTHRHRLLIPLSTRTVCEEIMDADTVIRSIDPGAARLMRPPMGLASSSTLDAIQSCEYRAVVGDVYPRDPHRPGTAVIVRRVLERVRNGSIIILHDGGTTPAVDRGQTVAAVEQLVPQLKQRGFVFRKLSELLTAS